VPYSLGVVGLGQMAKAILLPLIEKGDYLPSEIVGIVGSENSVKPVLTSLPEGINVISSTSPSLKKVWESPIVLLAVKPQQLNLVCEKLGKDIYRKSTQKNLLISVIAGLNLNNLKQLFPYHNCVRVVPNAPVLVSAGLTGIAWGDDVTNKQKQNVQNIFRSISRLVELPERQLDAFLALTSSGPAFIALIIEALADGAVAAGLSRSMAVELACETLNGTISLLEKKDLHPGELKDMVASPSGTTIEGLRCLEKAGVRSALIEAIAITAERSRSISQT
tara:strand:- start:349 stop:1182 length:834 start_codon:yes stop_codon:yes gene_type:complete